ncbi:DMT family transporter [Solwaraspora sp. WMMD406]|uniref:DMT family transporter n=1 Tax=Solwaraspora sp. WMMD406 TaxID=3016095 RepID=UPI0024179B13|nr:DMT family transporter [Solwaraspora sp. WMMD406]MDG4766430.1 DMT family transporter [Solwaraspora sp. WMMD406]
MRRPARSEPAASAAPRPEPVGPASAGPASVVPAVPPAVPARVVPPWLALIVAALGGVASASQSAVNAELGARMGNAVVGAAVNNIGGSSLIVCGLLLVPSMRAGLRTLRRARLPWWTYLGGIGGGFLVIAATYAVPVLGVAVFTIAQVAGTSVGGLAVDRTGLAPAGRLALSGPRLTGALLGIGAVAVAQIGRPVGQLAVGLVALAVAGGLAVAIQSALNGRVSAASTTAAGTVVNFAVATPMVLGVAVVLGASGAVARGGWPGDWFLYLGGLFGVMVMVALLVGVRSVGVLRTGLGVVGGQLIGALLIDVLRPDGPGVGVGLLAGAGLIVAAVLVSGRGTAGVRDGTRRRMADSIRWRTK